MAILKENWNDLKKPSTMNVEYLDDSKTQAVITIEPLERGFGTTLGNALRRTLLSSIRGFAVSSVAIDGVLHEYSTIDGIREDVIDILMNIKNLVINKGTSAAGTMKLKASKKGPVLAKDIVLNNDIEILNPDLVICNIEGDNVNLNMDMIVECGYGYSLANDSSHNGEISRIYLDALYSPVKKVAYTVDNARVGQATDYDKLTLEVHTNGTVSPEDAVGLAAKILQDQLEPFINFKMPVEAKNDSLEEKMNGYNPNLFKKIDEMELSVRSYNCLNNENIIYIADLVQKTEMEMLKLPNFGRKSLTELKDNLKLMGLSFGMKLENWPPENLEELSSKKDAF